MLLSLGMLYSVLTFAGPEIAPVRRSVLCIRNLQVLKSSLLGALFCAFGLRHFLLKSRLRIRPQLDALLCDGLLLISTFPSSESCFGLTDALILPRLPEGSVIVFSHLNLRVDSIAQWYLSLHVQPNLFLNFRPFPLTKSGHRALTSSCCYCDLEVAESQSERSLVDRRLAFSSQSWLKWLRWAFSSTTGKITE